MNKNLVTKKQNTKMLAGLYLGWHLKTVRCKNVTLRAALFVRYKLQSRCNTVQYGAILCGWHGVEGL